MESPPVKAQGASGDYGKGILKKQARTSTATKKTLIAEGYTTSQRLMRARRVIHSHEFYY
jgi:hypothetical protein